MNKYKNNIKYVDTYVYYIYSFLEGIYNPKFINYCYSLKDVVLYCLLVHSPIYSIILSFIDSLYKYLLSTLYVASTCWVLKLCR